MKNILSYKRQTFSGLEIKEWIEYHSTHITSKSKIAMKMRKYLNIKDDGQYYIYKSNDRTSSSYGYYQVIEVNKE